jgi:hypothetical protein
MVTIPFYKYFGEELRLRKRGILAKQNVVTKFQMNMIDDYSGVNLNLNEVISQYQINNPKLIIALREATNIHPEIYMDDAVIINPEEGLVEFMLPQEVRRLPGVYNAEIALIDSNGAEDQLFAHNSFYIYNEPTHWTDRQYTLPSIYEIRLSLRDSDYVENELINNVDFDVAEISYAATRTVMFWNEVPPPVKVFSTSTFPFRNIWLTGIQLFLFEAIEEHYRRNWFPHSSGGVSIDDKNKFRLYKDAWLARLQLFRSDIMKQKIRINTEMTHGIVGGYYSFQIPQA